MSNKEAYIAKMKTQLDDLNTEVDKLEAKAKEARVDVREKYQKEMFKLHQQSTLALAKLEEIKSASTDSWENLVAETEKIRDAFVHSFRHFKSQL